MRRNEPSLHISTSIQTAIHIANYMMTRSLEWAVQNKHSESAHLLTSLTLITKLCMGEYDQLYNRFNFDISIHDYLEKSKNKTALLMAHCFKCGAEIAKSDPKITQLLYEFGEALGMAFQIQDDILDFTNSSAETGKPAGSDLKNGNITLPVIYALQDPHLSSDIRKLNSQSTHQHFDHMIEQISKSKAIDLSYALRLKYIHKSKNIIQQLNGFPAHQDLETLLDYFLTQ